MMSHTHCKFCAKEYHFIAKEFEFQDDVTRECTLHGSTDSDIPAFALLAGDESSHFDCYIEAVFWKMRGKEEEDD